MARNSLYPGFINLYYTVGTNDHKMTFGVKDITEIPPSSFGIEQRNGTVVDWVTGVTALVTIIKPLFNATCTFTDADLWRVPSPTSDDALFLATANLAIAGTSGSAVNLASQITFSYRTGNGGVGKLTLLDTTSGVNLKLKAPSYGSAANLAVVNYLIGTTNIVYSRSNGFPLSVPKILTKTNDKLRRKYNLA